MNAVGGEESRRDCEMVHIKKRGTKEPDPNKKKDLVIGSVESDHCNQTYHKRNDAGRDFHQRMGLTVAGPRLPIKGQVPNGK